MEDLKISNELISEVLECNCTDSKIIANELSYEAFGISYVNIYEFAFKCKEWAFKRGLNLWTDYLGNCQIQDKDFQLLHDCYSDTEVKVIIKASEWLLEQNK